MRLSRVLALAMGFVVTSVMMPSVDATAAPEQDWAKWVNPFVGTRPGGADHGTGGGAGNTFPGAVVPFGMVQWSPDTVKQQHGGYFYDDNQLRGFSLTHLSGAGCSTYEDVPFIPFAGEVTTSPATDPGRYYLGFSHANEQAAPGRYQVTLDSGVKVELSATQRTGSGRFTYPAGATSTLLINAAGSVMGTDDAQLDVGKDSISGWASSGRFCGTNSHYRVYFYAKFDTPFASTGTWRYGAVTPNTVSGPGGGWVTFPNLTGTTVNVQVGLSFVSVDGAKANLRAENTRSFDDIAAAARKSWNDRLGQIVVEGGTDAQRTTFYTSLYHSLIQPNVFSDIDGNYPGFDGRVHTADNGHAMYTNFSGWDIYRSEVQLLALLAPKETSDIARSMIAFAEQGGSWDRWTVANDYTGVMNGDPYHIIVSTAYAFGATDFDANKALLLMLKGATQTSSQGYVERPGLEDYLRLGYVPGAGADTLEYTSADFSIAQLARRLDDGATFQDFMKRAQNWRNLFNPATGYLQPRRADGSFGTPYDPASSSGWVEGNGAQYSWMVPYNVAGLFTAFGGNQAVVSRLDTFFSQLNAGTRLPYAFLGNEPTLQTPWFYDFAGAPYKTQALVRRVMDELYNPNPEGLVGNDDLGEMSSWYVWAAVGMYPEIPGRAEMVLGSPLFSKAVVKTGAGKTITINGTGDGPYVTGLKVNGVATTRTWLPEGLVSSGGTLDFTRSGTPDTTWGTAPADAPPSFRDGEAPSLSFVDPARVMAPAGSSARTAVGVQDLSGVARTWHWSASPPAGITVTPSSGDLVVPAGTIARASVTVNVAAGTANGSYQVPVTFTSPGQPGMHATIGVLVAEPGSWLAALNNTGISPDSKPSSANFDGVGYSYSSDAVAAAGVRPGGTVTVDGLSYTWPSAPAGESDNAQAQGQTVNVQGAGRLAFLGAASNGNASGTVTVTYTDGTTGTAEIGFSDWTLGGGTAQPAYGNRTAITTSYRNSMGGDPQQVRTYVFATAPITLTAGKQVAKVTLPATVTGGSLHVFGIAVGA
ncbi:MAG TPA: GH92 family glycosyl hydrolase [Amycolatopsis sp.]|uniref:GH92 family glycosyl hydrolase n=1 Tax=Amycolatopsis sp. TaxID=37632 RepID=UPI002B465554|nr:GH92 family glycosyl hydrolase [Amycolatopsis sp.]HKS49250.1 GH92 family glycosyl hydrolase [Amycolatopsis sp.]